MDVLPLRLEDRLSRVLGVQHGDLTLVPREAGALPTLRCVLRQPATRDAAILLRVHTRSGIPLAYSRVNVVRGDEMFEASSFTVLAMEGYSHLAETDRLDVEMRIWSRRAYATASMD